MKKIFILFFFISLSYSTKATAENFSDKLLISISGGPGLILATGDLPDSAIPETQATTYVGPGGVIGIYGGYNFFKSTISKYDHSIYAMVGNEFAFKNLVVDFEFPQGDGEATYRTSFFNFLGFVRGIAGWVYYEAGFFYGIEALEWRYHYHGVHWNASNRRIYGDESNNEFGMLVGFGGAFPIIKELTLDAGMQFQFGLTSILENNVPDTDMHEVSILFKFGITYKFQ